MTKKARTFYANSRKKRARNKEYISLFVKNVSPHGINYKYKN